MLITALYLVIYAAALLVLVSLGLAVIFGMMRVINLAHGEFIMLGAYACVFATMWGAPLWLAFIIASVAVGMFGVIVERVMARFLYGRMLDTLLATWGLSLFLVGIVTTLLGPQGRSVQTSFGSLTIAGTGVSSYSFVVIGMAAMMVVTTWALMKLTRYGLIVRGTMQNAEIASALGVNRGLTYMATFGFGAALAGLAGAVLAPITGAAPTMGLFFVAKAFINVIIGGHLPMIGTLTAASLFGSIDGIVSFVWSSVVGEVSVLISALFLLRLLPLGITGHFRRGL